MICDRKVLIVSVFGVMLAACSAARAADPVAKTQTLESTRGKMHDILKAIADGDLAGGQAGLTRLFEGVASDQASKVVPAVSRKEGGRFVKTAAGDGDKGWPPENPFGPQHPPRQNPPRQDPPRQDPPRQDPPRQDPPRRDPQRPTPPREIPQLPPSNIPGTTHPAK